MAPLQGLSGLYADPQDTTDVMDEGVLEAHAAPGTPYAGHSQYGSQSDGYSGTVPDHQPYAPQEVYDGWNRADTLQYGGIGYPETGQEIDRTPWTHVSPYPRGIIQQSWDNPDALARYGVQQTELHGPDLGGVARFSIHSPAGHEEDTHYTTDDYVAPNENVLSSDVAGQLKAGWPNGATGHGAGNADTTQGYGVLNTLPEFQAGHSIRRVQHDTVHFDFTGTHGEQEVPFQGRHPVQQMPLDGPDSPYFEQGDIDGANIVWEGRIGYPTPYDQPAEPTVVAAAAYPDVWAWN
jgi:hypothetical protein